MDNIGGMRWAFAFPLDTIACSDDRVKTYGGRKIGLAGQLILASEAEKQKFIRAYRRRIPNVSAHSFCGAGKHQYDKGGYDNLSDYANSSDQYAILESKSLALSLGSNFFYFDIPDTLHDARALIVDGTGLFNPACLGKIIPSHFLSSAPGFGLSNEYCLYEWKLLADIAFAHGFGKLFSARDPFYIFISARDKRQMDELIELATDVAGIYKNKVKVHGFNAVKFL